MLWRKVWRNKKPEVTADQFEEAELDGGSKPWVELRDSERLEMDGRERHKEMEARDVPGEMMDPSTTNVRGVELVGTVPLYELPAEERRPDIGRLTWRLANAHFPEVENRRAPCVLEPWGMAQKMARRIPTQRSSESPSTQRRPKIKRSNRKSYPLSPRRPIRFRVMPWFVRHHHCQCSSHLNISPESLHRQNSHEYLSVVCSMHDAPATLILPNPASHLDDRHSIGQPSILLESRPASPGPAIRAPAAGISAPYISAAPSRRSYLPADGRREDEKPGPALLPCPKYMKRAERKGGAIPTIPPMAAGDAAFHARGGERKHFLCRRTRAAGPVLARLINRAPSAGRSLALDSRAGG